MKPLPALEETLACASTLAREIEWVHLLSGRNDDFEAGVTLILRQPHLPGTIDGFTETLAVVNPTLVAYGQRAQGPVITAAGLVQSALKVLLLKDPGKRFEFLRGERVIIKFKSIPLPFLQGPRAHDEMRREDPSNEADRN